jgi:threonine dehydratase
MVSFNDINKAYEILEGVIKYTSLKKSKTFSEMTSSNVYLKMENLQLTGSFKIRGAYNKIYHLTDTEKKNGVVCSSAGNHAQGVAFASNLLKVKSTVFMPIFAPPTKILATRGYGADVKLEGNTYDDSYNAAKLFSEKNNVTFVHPFNDKFVIAGQGTIGIEIFNTLNEVDVVIVPIGGGGLISGVAIALKHLNPNIKVIGVEAEGAQAMLKSVKAKRIVPMKDIATIADGIAVKNPGDLTFEIIRKYVDKIVTIDDNTIAQTMYHLLQRAKLVVEPAGAVSLAAIHNKKVSYPGKNVVALLSGGNVNLSLLNQVIEQGMMYNNLMSRISIVAHDRPKILKDILTVLSSINANVQNITQDRSTTSVPVGHVKITITFQVLGKEQLEFIIKELKKKNLKGEISC